MVHAYQWSRWSGTPFRRSKILANEISRCLQETRSIQRPRLVRWKFIKEFPAHSETSHGRRLLRRDSAVGRAIQEDHAAGSDNHRSIRWRRAGRAHILSRSYGEHRRKRGRNIFSSLAHGTMLPRVRGPMKLPA